MTCAIGRPVEYVEYYDERSIRRITREAAGTGLRRSALMIGIVNRLPVQMRSVS